MTHPCAPSYRGRELTPDDIMAKVTVEDGHWLWPTTRPYGEIRRGGVKKKAHRVVYEMFKGPIPDGYDIDHLCRVTRCVAPDHLEAVTHRENVLRGEGEAARKAKQTHCVNGHEFDYVRTDGGRGCRTCSRAYKRDWERKNRGSSNQ